MPHRVWGRASGQANDLDFVACMEDSNFDAVRWIGLVDQDRTKNVSRVGSDSRHGVVPSVVAFVAC